MLDKVRIVWVQYSLASEPCVCCRTALAQQTCHCRLKFLKPAQPGQRLTPGALSDWKCLVPQLMRVYSTSLDMFALTCGGLQAASDATGQRSAASCLWAANFIQIVVLRIRDINRYTQAGPFSSVQLCAMSDTLHSPSADYLWRLALLHNWSTRNTVF